MSDKKPSSPFAAAVQKGRDDAEAYRKAQSAKTPAEKKAAGVAGSQEVKFFTAPDGRVVPITPASGGSKVVKSGSLFVDPQDGAPYKLDPLAPSGLRNAWNDAPVKSKDGKLVQSLPGQGTRELGDDPKAVEAAAQKEQKAQEKAAKDAEKASKSAYDQATRDDEAELKRQQKIGRAGVGAAKRTVAEADEQFISQTAEAREKAKINRGDVAYDKGEVRRLDKALENARDPKEREALEARKAEIEATLPAKEKRQHELDLETSRAVLRQEEWRQQGKPAAMQAINAESDRVNLMTNTGRRGALTVAEGRGAAPLKAGTASVDNGLKNSGFREQPDGGTNLLLPKGFSVLPDQALPGVNLPKLAKGMKLLPNGTRALDGLAEFDHINRNMEARAGQVRMGDIQPGTRFGIAQLPTPLANPNKKHVQPWETEEAVIAQKTAREVGKLDFHLPDGFAKTPGSMDAGAGKAAEEVTFNGAPVGRVERDAFGLPSMTMARGGRSPSLTSGNPYDGVPEYADVSDDVERRIKSLNLDPSLRADLMQQATDRRWPAEQIKGFTEGWRGANDGERGEMIRALQPELAKDVDAWLMGERSMPRLDIRGLYTSGQISAQEARMMERTFYNETPITHDYALQWRDYLVGDSPQAQAIRAEQTAGGNVRRYASAIDGAASQFIKDTFERDRKRADFDPQAFSDWAATVSKDTKGWYTRLVDTLDSAAQSGVGSSLGAIYGVAIRAPLTIVKGAGEVAGLTKIEGTGDITKAGDNKGNGAFSWDEVDLMMAQTGESAKGTWNFMRDRSLNPGTWWSGKEGGKLTAKLGELTEKAGAETLTEGDRNRLAEEIKTGALALTGQDAESGAFYDIRNPDSPAGQALAAYEATRDPVYLDQLKHALTSTPRGSYVEAAAQAYASAHGTISEDGTFGRLQSGWRGAQTAAMQEQAVEAISGGVEAVSARLLARGLQGAKKTAEVGKAMTWANRAALQAEQLGDWFQNAGLKAGADVRNTAVQGLKTGAVAFVSEGMEGIPTAMAAGGTAGDVIDGFIQEGLGAVGMGPVMSAFGAGANAAAVAMEARKDTINVNRFVEHWNKTNPDDTLTADDWRQARGYLAPGTSELYTRAREAMQVVMGGKAATNELAKGEATPERVAQLQQIVADGQAAVKELATVAQEQHARTREAKEAMQEVNGIDDPTLKAFADAAIKSARGAVLTPDEQAALERAVAGVPPGEVPQPMPAMDAKGKVIKDIPTPPMAGVPLARREADGRYVITDAGLETLREAMPRTAGLMLPQDERSQMQVPGSLSLVPGSEQGTQNQAPGTVPTPSPQPGVSNAVAPEIAGASQPGSAEAKLPGSDSSVAPGGGNVTTGQQPPPAAGGTFTVPVTITTATGATRTLNIPVLATNAEAAKAAALARPQVRAQTRNGGTAAAGEPVAQSGAASGGTPANREDSTANPAQSGAVEPANAPNREDQPTAEAVVEEMEKERVNWFWRTLREAVAVVGYKLADTGIKSPFLSRFASEVNGEMVHKPLNWGLSLYDRLNPGSEMGQWMDGLKSVYPEMAAYLKEHASAPMFHRVWFGHDPLANVAAIVEKYGVGGLPEFAGQLLKDSTTPAGIPLPGVQWLVHAGAVKDTTATEWLSLNMGEALGHGLAIYGTYRLYKTAKSGKQIHTGWAAFGIAMRLIGGVWTMNPVLILSGLANLYIVVSAKRGAMKAGMQKLREMEKQKDKEKAANANSQANEGQRGGADGSEPVQQRGSGSPAAQPEPGAADAGAAPAAPAEARRPDSGGRDSVAGAVGGQAGVAPAEPAGTGTGAGDTGRQALMAKARALVEKFQPELVKAGVVPMELRKTSDFDGLMMAEPQVDGSYKVLVNLPEIARVLSRIPDNQHAPLIERALNEEVDHWITLQAVSDERASDLWTALPAALQERVKLAYYKGGDITSPAEAGYETIRILRQAFSGKGTTEEVAFMEDVKAAARTDQTLAQALLEVLRDFSAWIRVNLTRLLKEAPEARQKLQTIWRDVREMEQYYQKLIDKAGGETARVETPPAGKLAGAPWAHYVKPGTEAARNTGQRHEKMRDWMRTMPPDASLWAGITDNGTIVWIPGAMADTPWDARRKLGIAARADNQWLSWDMMAWKNTDYRDPSDVLQTAVPRMQNSPHWQLAVDPGIMEIIREWDDARGIESDVADDTPEWTGREPLPLLTPAELKVLIDAAKARRDARMVTPAQAATSNAIPESTPAPKVRIQVMPPDKNGDLYTAPPESDEDVRKGLPVKKEEETGSGGDKEMEATRTRALEPYQTVDEAIASAEDKNEAWRLGFLKRGITNRQDVSAAGVDSKGIKLPEGYTKQGDRYVFQSPESNNPVPGGQTGSGAAVSGSSASTGTTDAEASPSESAAVENIVTQSAEKATPSWAAILTVANDLTIQEFAGLALKGRIQKATGAVAEQNFGTLKSPLSLGFTSGYSLEDIAHFYIARTALRGVAQEIESQPDPATNEQIRQAFDEFTADAAAEQAAMKAAPETSGQGGGNVYKDKYGTELKVGDKVNVAGGASAEIMRLNPGGTVRLGGVSGLNEAERVAYPPAKLSKQQGLVKAGRPKHVLHFPENIGEQVIQDYDQIQAASKAIDALEPVAADVVERFNPTLPEGYTQEGDFYVYRPQKTSAPQTPQQAATPPATGVSEAAKAKARAAFAGLVDSETGFQPPPKPGQPPGTGRTKPTPPRKPKKAKAETTSTASGAASGEIPAETPPPATQPTGREAAKEKAKQAFKGLFTGKRLAGATVELNTTQKALPADKLASFIDLAQTLVAENVSTPEGLAAFLDDLFPNGGARPYSQALWDAIGMVNLDLAGNHDWALIYTQRVETGDKETGSGGVEETVGQPMSDPPRSPLDLTGLQSGITEAGTAEGNILDDFALELRKIEKIALAQPSETLFPLPTAEKRPTLSLLRDAIRKRLDEVEVELLGMPRLWSNQKKQNVQNRAPALENAKKRLTALHDKVEAKMLEAVRLSALADKAVSNDTTPPAETEGQKKIRKVKERERKKKGIEKKDTETGKQGDKETTPGITDFGEKIGGARKDRWKLRGLALTDLEGMTPEERQGYITKDHVWPVPDFEDWVKGGMPAHMAWMIKQARDSLGTGPDLSEANRYNAYGYTGGAESKDGLADKMREKYVRVMGLLRDGAPAVRTLEDYENWLKDARVAANGSSGYDWSSDGMGIITGTDRRGRTKWQRLIWYPFQNESKAKAHVESTGWPISNEPWMRLYELHLTPVGSKSSEYNRASNEWVTHVSTEPEWFITKPKSGYIIAKGFATRDAGVEWARSAYAAKMGQRKKAGGKLTRPLKEDPERTGPDLRAGVDMTGEDILKTFGFRGGEFGNWTNQADRQQSLNAAYDGLHDLARVLSIHPKAVSLDGKMGIAFGARGSGKASAHYEPTKVVINLTRTSGAGALAHEWAHAADDYFGKLATSASANYVSDWARQKSYHGTGARMEVIVAWTAVMDAIHKRKKDAVTVIKEAKADIERGRKSFASWLPKGWETHETYGPLVRMVTGEMPAIMHGKEADRFVVLDQLIERLPKDYRTARVQKAFRNNYRYINSREETLKAAEEGTIYGSQQVNTRYVEDAKKLGEYWSRDHELFARAFESYVQYKLELNGEKSEYLVHSAKGANLTNEIESGEAAKEPTWESAYPQGRDAEAIFAAFDKLFQTIKVKESPAGMALYTGRRLAGANIVQKSLPADKMGAFIDLAQTLIAEGIDTPEALGAFLDETFPDGGARSYSQALWMALGMVNLDLRGAVPVWDDVYAAQPLDTSPPADDTTAPNESGDTNTGNAGVSGGRPLDTAGAGVDEGLAAGPSAEPGVTAGSGGTGGEPVSESELGAGDTTTSPEKPKRPRGGRSGVRSDDSGPGAAGGESGTANGRFGVRRDSGEVEVRSGPDVEPGDNLRIQPGDVLVPGGPQDRIEANITAIQLLRQKQQDGTQATPEEKRVLAKFTGWGSIFQVFGMTALNSYQQTKDIMENYGYEQGRDRLFGEARTKFENWYDNYGSAYEQLKELLTPAEWESAKESSLNAHYTHEEVIRLMWEGVDHLGFKGGSVVEPSAGIGHFIGLTPDSLAGKVTFTGVELDSITGGLLKLLYPRSDVQVTGYESSQRTVNNSADLVMTNFPFGNYQVADIYHPDYDGWSIHDYFLARSVDNVKPGGLVVAITSRFTLDGKGKDSIRQYVAGKADLVGAFRLPNNAFAKNAGTQVVTDILIFRKRSDLSNTLKTKWTTTTTIEIGKDENDQPITAQINEYYRDHPEHVLGTQTATGSMYGGNEYTVEGVEGEDLAARLRAAFQSLPANIFGAEATATKGEKVRVEGAKDGSFIEVDGKIYRANSEGEAEPVELKAAPLAKVRKFIAVRDAVVKQQELETSNASDEQIEANRRELNEFYDKFVKAHEALNKGTNASLLEEDPEWPLVSNLEDEVSFTEETTIKSGKNAGQPRSFIRKRFEKGPMLLRRVNPRASEPDSAASVADALAISVAYRGGVQPNFMAKLLGKTPEEVITELEAENATFENPETGQLETAEVYLSGFVRLKLRAAETAAQTDPKYDRNVVALREVQPPPVPIELATFRLGANFIPAPVIKSFLRSVMGVTADVNLYRAADDTRWVIAPDGLEGQSTANTQTWAAGSSDEYGLPAKTALAMIEDSLNLKLTEVTRTEEDENGNIRTIKLAEETAAARSMQERIQDEFRRWVLATPDAASAVGEAFNTFFNGVKVRETRVPQIEHFPNASTEITLRYWQKRAAYRALQEGLILGHDVGTGKTYTIITIASEAKRLSLAEKPMVVVQNSTLGQFARSFKRLYPGARLLVGNASQTKGDKRKDFIAKAAVRDWDCIVIPMSFFERLPNDPQRERDYVQSKLDEIDAAIVAAEREAGNSKAIDLEKATARTMNSQLGKQLIRVRKRYKARMDRVMARINEKSDDLITFDQMGVDMLLVDEAHAFKRGDFYTKMDPIKGLDTNGSDRSLDFLLKTQFIHDRTPDRNVILATGTPISNTVAEMWTMLRYVRPQMIKKFNVETFDDFAGTFTQATASIQETPSGDFKQVLRLGRYANGTEINALWRSGVDIYALDKADLKDVPDMRGGAVENVSLDRTPGVARFIEFIRLWRKWYEELEGRDKVPWNWLPVVQFGLARKASLDMRLINPSLTEEPGNKTDWVTRTAFEAWQNTADNKGVQLIFSNIFRSHDPKKRWLNEDMGIPNPLYRRPMFNVFAEIKARLIKLGIPEEQIADFSEMTKDQIDKTAEKMKLGEVRIALGSTETLGTGLNVQDKIVEIYHLDQQFRPMDFIQRNGRGIRQGNENKIVGIRALGMRQTLDSTLASLNLEKSAMVSQAMQGKLGREFEDPADEGTLTYQQMVAAFSGNPLAGKRFALQNDVRQLEILQEDHARRLGNVREEIRDIENDSALFNDRAKRAAVARLRVQRAFPTGKVTEAKGKAIDIKGEKISAQFDAAINTFKEKFIKAAEADVASGVVFKRMLQKHNNKLGVFWGVEWFEAKGIALTVNGVTVQLDATVTIDGERIKNKQEGAVKVDSFGLSWKMDAELGSLDIRHDKPWVAYTTTLSGSASSGSGLVRSIESEVRKALEQGTEEQITTAQKRTENKLKELRLELERPWEQLDRLNEQRLKLAEAETALQASEAPQVFDDPVNWTVRVSGDDALRAMVPAATVSARSAPEAEALWRTSQAPEGHENDPVKVELVVPPVDMAADIVAKFPEFAFLTRQGGEEFSQAAQLLAEEEAAARTTNYYRKQPEGGGYTVVKAKPAVVKGGEAFEWAVYKDGKGKKADYRMIEVSTGLSPFVADSPEGVIAAAETYFADEAKISAATWSLTKAQFSNGLTPRAAALDAEILGKYQIGDRVTWENPQEDRSFQKMVGTIIGITASRGTLNVQLDDASSLEVPARHAKGAGRILGTGKRLSLRAPSRGAGAHRASITQQGAAMRQAANAPATAGGAKLPGAKGTTQDAGSLLRDLFYGRHDVLEAIMPGTKRLIQENRLDVGFFRAATKSLKDQQMQRITQAFGSPKFWNMKRRAKMSRFLSELLPAVSRLNATAYSQTGNLVFSDFDRPVGFISDADMKTAGVKPGDVIPLPGSTASQMVDIGQRVPERGGHVLTEPMPASTQAQVYTDFAAAYPEGEWVLEEFIAPGMEQVREVGPGGTIVPVMNRGSLLNYINEDWPPALAAMFTAQPLPPITLTEGWTPDIARQRTAVAYLGALLRTMMASIRKTRTGERIESGDLHDLIEGFEIAAFEAAMEKSRLMIRNKLINQTATSAPPPASGLREFLSQWTPMDDVILGTLKAFVLSRKLALNLIPEKGNPLTPDQRALATRLLGDGVRFWGTDHALPRRIYQEFLSAEGRDVVTNKLLRAADWFIKRYVAGLMVDLGTFVVNVVSNPVLRQMAGLNRLAYAITSAAHGDWAGMKLGALEWAHLMRGLVRDQMPLLQKRILSAIPSEIYDDNTTYAQADGMDPMKGALAELKDFNPGAAFLKALRYGAVDQGAKIGVHYALLRARASVAADKAKVNGKARRDFIRDWMDNARTKHRNDFEETYQQTLDFMLDMANDVPVLVDPSQSVFNAAGQPSQIERVLKRGMFSLYRYKAAMARYGVRNTIGSAKALGDPTLPSEQRAQAAANLLMMTALAGVGWLLTGDGGDDDEDPLTGRLKDDFGKLLPQSVRTGDRMNASKAGRKIAAWLRAHGVPIKEDGTVEPGTTEEDLWVKTSKLPLTSSAVMLGHLINGHPFEALDMNEQIWMDLLPSGPLIRLNPLTYDASWFDKGKSYRVVAADQLFDLLTSPILPSRLRESAVRIVDPQDRLLRPESDIGYNPGLKEVFQTNIPWLSLMVPPRATYELTPATRFSATQWHKEKLAAIMKSKDLSDTNKKEMIADIDARFPLLKAAEMRQYELLEKFGVDPTFIEPKRSTGSPWPADLQKLQEKGYGEDAAVVMPGSETITRKGDSKTYPRLVYPNPDSLTKKTGRSFLLGNLTGLNILPVERGALREELDRRKVKVARTAADKAKIQESAKTGSPFSRAIKAARPSKP